MAKDTKTVSLRLPVEQVEYLSTKSDSINQAVVDVVDKLRLIEKYADRDIQGVFTSAEWMYLADSLNGTIVEGDFRYIASALCASVEDSARYDGLDAKYEVKIEELCTKINRLSSSAIEAIFRRVEAFWYGAPVDFEQWSNY